MMQWLIAAPIVLVPAFLFFLIVRLSPTKRLESYDRDRFADAEARAALASLQARGGGIGGMGGL